MRTAHLLRTGLLAAAVLFVLPVVASATPTITGVAPAVVTIGKDATVIGAVDSGLAGEQVRLEQHVAGAWVAVGTTVTTTTGGAWTATFVPRRSGALHAVQLTGTLGTSAEAAVKVAPKVLTARTTRGAIYPFLGTNATWRVAPADYPTTSVRAELTIDGRAAGSVRATLRGGTVTAKLPTNGTGRYRVRLVLPQLDTFEATSSLLLAFNVRGARVGSGASATWVRSLRAGLAFRGVHVPSTSSFDSRMGDAVIAFHKGYGRARTTSFEATDWTRLTRARIRPRYLGAGTHIEVDKGRQLLLRVTDGRVVTAVHISSGVTGNTPAGHHSVLWKGRSVPSLYGSLLPNSMAFRGAYAIHGYPSVPTTAASHGCVRVPLWIAGWLYDHTPVGTDVWVYESGRGTISSVGVRSSGGVADVPELTGVDPKRWADEA